MLTKRIVFSVFLILVIGFSAASQQVSPTSSGPVLTDAMIAKSIEFDVKRFSLSPEQTIQDKKVMVEYQDKSNALAHNSNLSVDQLKEGIRKARLELAAGYKSFLNPEQYGHSLETYNKMHPNDQIH